MRNLSILPITSSSSCNGSAFGQRLRYRIASHDSGLRESALGVLKKRILPYLVRGRASIYGRAFQMRVQNLGIEQLKTTPRSRWQSGYAERWIGTLRRDLLDHVIVLGERHLLRLVRQYVNYYNADRPHMSLDGDAPEVRSVEPPTAGRVVVRPRVGGIHHRYARAA
jgi:transposase InsO family protein